MWMLGTQWVKVSSGGGDRGGGMPFGGSSHGAFVCGGDSDAVGGRLLIEEVEGPIGELMVHPVSVIMQSLSSARSRKGLELETEGDELQVCWVLVERNVVCRQEGCWCRWRVSRFVHEEGRCRE